MQRQLIETLAKVIAATGWADGNLSHEEIGNLKDLIFQFEESVFYGSLVNHSSLPARHWALFEMYIESPIDAAEREHLVNELREVVWSEEDRTLILSALQKMAEADGKITTAEQVVLKDIVTKIESVDTGFFGDLQRLVRMAMQRRADAIHKTPDRAKYFEEFLKNKLYYEVRRRLDLGEAKIEISDSDLRKLSVIGGLMARVAQIDNIFLEKESDKISSILQGNWNLSREEAAFVIAVANLAATREFDYLRMTREFLVLAAPGERFKLLGVLFTVAIADDKISDAELQEIHRIAQYLLMSTNRVNEAYSKIII